MFHFIKQLGDIGDERYFTSMIEGNSESWNVSSITLTGDFKFKALVESVSSKNFRLLGTAFSFTSFCSISATKLSCTTSGAVNEVTGTFDIRAGEFVILEIERVGTVITWTLDGVLLGTKTGASTANFVVQRIGEVNGFFNNGKIADLEIYDAGTLNNRWAIDESDPSSITDTVGSNTGTGNNITSADADLHRKIGGVWTEV